MLLYSTVAAVPSGDLFSTLFGARPGWLAVALLVIAIGYAVKVFRWQTMLRGLEAPVKFGDVSVPYMGCVALNNILPFRAGDIIRVVGFRRVTKLTRTAQLGTLLLERLLDVCVLAGLLLAVTAVSGSAAVTIPTFVEGGIMVAGVVAAIAVVIIMSPALVRIAADFIASHVPRFRAGADIMRGVLESIQALCRPMIFMRLILLSVLAWLFEAAVFFAVGNSLDLPLTPEIALFAMTVGTLSTIIPSAPGYIGTFHFFTASALLAFQFNNVESAAFAILVHGLLWLATTSVGLLLLSMTVIGSMMREFLTSKVASERESQ